MTVRVRQRQHQQREIFGERMRVGGGVYVQYLAYSADFRCIGHRSRRFMTGYQQMNLAADLRRGSDGAERRAMERRIVVFSNNKNGHDQITLASLRSLSINVAMSGTIIPLLRAGGSVTSSTVRRGATSTPSASGVSVSSGFFFAFMMLGSVT